MSFVSYLGPAVSFWARELKVIANAAWTLVLDIMEQYKFDLP
jgi:hypothetical protein